MNKLLLIQKIKQTLSFALVVEESSQKLRFYVQRKFTGRDFWVWEEKKQKHHMNSMRYDKWCPCQCANKTTTKKVITKVLKKVPLLQKWLRQNSIEKYLFLLTDIITVIHRFYEREISKRDNSNQDRNTGVENLGYNQS